MDDNVELADGSHPFNAELLLARPMSERSLDIVTSEPDAEDGEFDIRIGSWRATILRLYGPSDRLHVSASGIPDPRDTWANRRRRRSENRLAARRRAKS